MWCVILFTPSFAEVPHFFRKKENTEDFFRRAIEEEIPYWENIEDFTPNDFGFDCWDDYIENCVILNGEEDVGYIRKIETED